MGQDTAVMVHPSGTRTCAAWAQSGRARKRGRPGTVGEFWGECSARSPYEFANRIAPPAPPGTSVRSLVRIRQRVVDALRQRGVAEQPDFDEGWGIGVGEVLLGELDEGACRGLAVVRLAQLEVIR